MKASVQSSLAVGLVAYLLCLLVPAGLKLTGCLDASWWFVLVALWGPAAFSLVFALVSLLVFSFFRQRSSHEPS